jgi:hypothetical protein
MMLSLLSFMISNVYQLEFMSGMSMGQAQYPMPSYAINAAGGNSNNSSGNCTGSS